MPLVESAHAHAIWSPLVPSAVARHQQLRHRQTPAPDQGHRRNQVIRLELRTSVYRLLDDRRSRQQVCADRRKARQSRGYAALRGSDLGTSPAVATACCASCRRPRQRSLMPVLTHASPEETPATGGSSSAQPCTSFSIAAAKAGPAAGFSSGADNDCHACRAAGGWFDGTRRGHSGFARRSSAAVMFPVDALYRRRNDPCLSISGVAGASSYSA